MGTNTQPEVWVGIDLGTQGVRAVATTGTGRVVGRGSAPLDSRRDGPRHEQDPEQWWSAVAAATRAAMTEAATPPMSVCGVAVCSTSGTLVLTGEQLNPLLPALMYDDQRAGADLARLVDQVSPDLWPRLGVRPQPSWAVAKLAWLATNATDLLATGIVLHQADFVTARLAGRRLATDTSHALKSAADPLTATWPDELRDALGLSAHALPDLVAPGTVIGEVCPAAAAETGLPPGTPIVAGMTDGCAAQLATGAREVGDWNSVLGTTLVLKGITEQRVDDPGGTVYSHRGPDGRWWPGGASSIGAGVLTSEFPGADLAGLDAAARLHEPAGCVRYPLAGRGERFPFAAPDATGFVIGQPRDDLDRYAAVLQGVAYVERLCFDHLASLGAPAGPTVRVTGGAVRSDAWTQLRADVLGRTLEVPVVTEPAFGMAVLAAAGTYGLQAAAERMVHVDRAFPPRPDVGQRLLPGYHQLVEALHERGWLTSVPSVGAA